MGERGHISRAEIQLAARLVGLGLVSREDMEAVLRDLSRQRAGRLDSSLESLLVKRGHVSATELPLLRPEEDAPPPQLPGFRVERLLGEGGTSRVYKASPRGGRRAVALKILKPHLARKPVAVRRFYREAELLIAFRHPHLVQGLKAGRLEGLHVFVLEYLPGRTVLDLLEREGPLPPAAALRILLQAARALAYLNARGIVHRDVKPGNLMLTREGTVKLFDLGLARVDPAEAEPTGTTVGTVHYLAPEQARGEAVDVRADIYSLGVTLYHMVVGEPPFRGETEREVLRQQLHATLKNPRGRRPEVTPLVHYFIEKMMAKDPELRYPHPEALVRDVEERLAGHRILGAEAPPPRRLPRGRPPRGSPPTSRPSR